MATGMGAVADAVGWRQRGLVLLAAVGSGLGAVAWWAASAHTVGVAILLVALVLTTVAPALLRRKPDFAVACALSGGLLVLVSVLLLFYLLVWSFLGALVVLMAGYADRQARPRASRVVGGLALLIALAVIGVFLAHDRTLLAP